jgi:hypothetical protein
MANTMNIELFYEALERILGNKLGVKIEGRVVPRKPEDGDALFKFK